MKRSEARRYRRHINGIINDLPDEAALDVTDLFLPWRSGEPYVAGDRRQHNGELYRCEQGHTAQVDWTPDVTPALWTKISIEEWPEWRQPTGAQDAYMAGDKVSHNGKHWICTLDYCTYEPGIYGWDEVEG